jgi:hypothetical protein
MEKFDSKKEKIPKVKDSINFKKFLSDKYLNKKYASITLDVEIAHDNEKVADSHTQQEISEPNSSSDDSSTPSGKETQKEKVITQENDKIFEDKENFENFEVNQVSCSPFDNDIIIYPNIANISTTDIIESSSPDLDCQVFKENGQNDRNLFFFENFNSPCDNSLDIKDWGIIWESTLKPQKTQKDNFIDTENKRGTDILDDSENQKKGETFDLLEKADGNTSNSCESKKSEKKKAEWEFPVEFDLVCRKENIASGTIEPPENLKNLSQNLNGIYSNYSNEIINDPNKKKFDDLERYLSDATFITPTDKKPISMPLPVNTLESATNSLISYNNINPTPSNFPSNCLFPNTYPQMLMNYSYNNTHVHNEGNQIQGYSNNMSYPNSMYYHYQSQGSIYGSGIGVSASNENELNRNMNLLNLNPQNNFHQQIAIQVNS